jgi:hypothetical protein
MVAGYYTGGGATSGNLNDRERELEADDDFIFTKGKHSLRVGVQSLAFFIHNYDPDTFNGEYIFGGGSAPALDANYNPTGETTTIDALEQYRRALLNLPGGTPTTFSNHHRNATRAGDPMAAGIVRSGPRQTNPASDGQCRLALSAADHSRNFRELRAARWHGLDAGQEIELVNSRSWVQSRKRYAKSMDRLIEVPSGNANPGTHPQGAYDVLVDGFGLSVMTPLTTAPAF